MLRYILKSIKKYYDYFIFMILGIFVIMTIFPLGVSSLLKIKVAVSGDISKYGRGEYDLLVRNKDSLTKIEKELKLIDECYASNAKGGISMKQYEDIKNIKGIEAAAPIANLGYFPGYAQFLSVVTESKESNKIELTYYTWDGANKYKVGESTAYQLSGENYVNKYGIINNDFDKENKVYKYMPYVIGTGVSGLYGYLDSKENKKLKVSSFMLPKTYSVLVAIDPIEENKIFKNGRYSTPGKELTKRKVEQVENVTDYFSGKNYSKVNKIPVVTNSEAPIRLEAKISIRKLNAPDQVLRQSIKKYGIGEYAIINLDYPKDIAENGKKLVGELESYIDKEELKGYINLEKSIVPFSNISDVSYECYGNKVEVLSSYNQSDKNVVLATEHYMVSDVIYEGNKDRLCPKAIGQNNGIITFGSGEKKGTLNSELERGNGKEVPIMFDSFCKIQMMDRSSLEINPKFNGAPLGIYGGDSIVQLEDNNGNQVNRFIDKTTEIGSLGKVMPNAYTTIDAASILKGDSPIDAIRVKVAGITEYNNAAKEKIERVATEIYNKTGLKVDFVAGSSTTKTVGQVEGIDRANGLGKIEKRWVTLGTDSLVTTNWNTSAFVLMIAFIVCGCLFVINRINSYMILRKREMNTLECTGWDKKYIAFVITGENVLAYLISTVFAVAVLLKMKIDKSVILTSVVVIFFIIILVSYFYTLKHKDGSKKKGYKSLSFTMVKLVLSDIVRNKNRYILLMTQLVLTATLGLFTLMSFNATRQSVNYTALGSQVNMSTSSIVKPIIMGSIILIIFTTFDRFTSLMLERKQEITLLKTLGWSKRKISGLMYGSLIMIGVIVTVITLGLTSLIGFVFYTSMPIKGIHMVGIALIILVICIIGGIYPIVNNLRKTILKYNANDR